jgi:hypothetical protein
MPRRRTRKNKAKANKTQVAAKLNYAVPTRNQRGSTSSIVSKALYNQVCALTNPFCPEAKGSRIPDDDSAPSLPVTLKGMWTFDTTTGGDFAIAIQPSIENTVKSATAISGNTITTWGDYGSFGDATTVTNNAAKYRIVSFGARVYSTLAPTNKSGWMKVMTSSSDTSNGFVFSGGFYDEVQALPVAVDDMHWISKPSGTTWKEYIDMDKTAAYTYLTVLGKGLPQGATSAVVVEVVMNIEALVDFKSLAAAASTPGIPHNPTAMQAASRTHAKHKGVHSGPSVMSTLGDMAKSAIGEVARMAIPYVGGFIGDFIKGRSRRNRVPAIGPHYVEVD